MDGIIEGFTPVKSINTPHIRPDTTYDPTRNKIIYNIRPITTVYIDTDHEKVFIDYNEYTDVFTETYVGAFIPFHEIVECSILENDATIQTTKTKTKWGITRAVVGGAFAGGVGAVVGAATAPSSSTSHSIGAVDHISVRIVTSNIQNPFYNIPILTGLLQRQSVQYNTLIENAQKIYATMIGIIHANEAKLNGSEIFPLEKAPLRKSGSEDLQ